MMCSYNVMDCRIIPKRIKHIDIRLFEEEIEEAKFLALSENLGYEQLFVKLVKEELDRKGLKVKNG
ncbi:MAG: hypothetical protein ACFFDF_25600 [Candidatus Odinarchaeota archaeon]